MSLMGWRISFIFEFELREFDKNTLVVFLGAKPL